MISATGHELLVIAHEPKLTDGSKVGVVLSFVVVKAHGRVELHRLWATDSEDLRRTRESFIALLDTEVLQPRRNAFGRPSTRMLPHPCPGNGPMSRECFGHVVDNIVPLADRSSLRVTMLSVGSARSPVTPAPVSERRDLVRI